MDTLTRSSPAKVNLTLRVAGARPDGFHELESLVARIDFCDTLTIAAREPGRWALQCDDPALPQDGSNLVLRAARALVELAGENHGLDITLNKQIPLGAGLGGGSSNAATTLMLLNDLWELKRSPEELAHIGAQLGSDVPLFLHRPLCILRGRGEHVVDVDRPLTAWVALLLPAIHCATPAVYAAWDAQRQHPQRPPLQGVLDTLDSPTELMDLLFNDLEEPAFAVQPELRALAERVSDVGGFPVRLTGSGAALFRLFDDESAATAFAAAITDELGVRSIVARTCT